MREAVIVSTARTPIGKACRGAFSLQADVPTCTGTRDGTCLTTAQKNVLATVFSGPTTSGGVRMYTSFPFDGGFGAPGAVTASPRRAFPSRSARAPRKNTS